MRVAYLECFSGISGDMLLAALLDAGISKELFQRTAAALNIGAELHIDRVDRSGISAAKIDVLAGGNSAGVSDQSCDHGHQHQHQAPPALEHGHRHAHGEGSRDHRTDLHQHPHEHQHGRSLSEIKKIIRSAEIPDQARETAIRAF